MRIVNEWQWKGSELTLFEHGGRFSATISSNDTISEIVSSNLPVKALEDCYPVMNKLSDGTYKLIVLPRLRGGALVYEPVPNNRGGYTYKYVTRPDPPMPPIDYRFGGIDVSVPSPIYHEGFDNSSCYPKFLEIVAKEFSPDFALSLASKNTEEFISKRDPNGT